MIAKNRSARDQGGLVVEWAAITQWPSQHKQSSYNFTSIHDIYLKTGGEEKFWKHCIYPSALSLATLAT